MAMNSRGSQKWWLWQMNDMNHAACRMPMQMQRMREQQAPCNFQLCKRSLPDPMRIPRIFNPIGRYSEKKAGAVCADEVTFR
jgi:hypothetical protein